MTFPKLSSGTLQDLSDHYKQLTDPPVDIFQSIKKGFEIAKFMDDWDGEGSCSYKSSTIYKSGQFLWNVALDFQRCQKSPLSAPRFSPGPDGSIDLHWKSSERELLINFPEEEDPITFYGDNSAGEIVKGTLDVSKSNQWLMLWLMQ